MFRRHLCVILMLMAGLSGARELKREFTLRGHWRFELGDDMAFADPDFQDSHWIKIRVPGEWEARGFPGYDGYAWYRAKVKFPKDLKQEELFIDIGNVDDVCAIYFNGQKIGQKGQFPPKIKKAWDDHYKFPIPSELIRYASKNVIAVRIYDSGGRGGIRSGKIGIYSRPRLNYSAYITGPWQFSPGDHAGWALKTCDDTDWYTLNVPSKWEDQGFKYLDGYAWYRKRVIIPASLRRKRPVLVLGMIDDMDEVYLNGERIGSTQPDRNDKNRNRMDTWKIERFYNLPETLIHWDEENLLAVRVFDRGGPGGMRQGKPGLLTYDESRKLYSDQHESLFDILNQLFEDFFL